ncbi:MAG: hypothetical protein NTX31_15975 [Burkholderiales bacterium]|jgi:hypothetical protein|nr:hypothetical protein [Burkholderiales bacterium]
MKSVLFLALAMAVPALALSQVGASVPAQTKAVAATPKLTPGVRRSALKAVEEVTPIDDDVQLNLTAEELELAKLVYVGVIPCELGASVTITPSEKRPGVFWVRTKNMTFRMHPVSSRTGAIRLEDPKAGAMWLQLGNKSMLMSQKLGQRLADECLSPNQAVVAENLKKNPVPSILDAPKVAPTK